MYTINILTISGKETPFYTKKYLEENNLTVDLDLTEIQRELIGEELVTKSFYNSTSQKLKNIFGAYIFDGVRDGKTNFVITGYHFREKFLNSIYKNIKENLPKAFEFVEDVNFKSVRIFPRVEDIYYDGFNNTARTDEKALTVFRHLTDFTVGENTDEVIFYGENYFNKNVSLDDISDMDDIISDLITHNFTKMLFGYKNRFELNKDTGYLNRLFVKNKDLKDGFDVINLLSLMINVVKFYDDKDEEYKLYYPKNNKVFKTLMENYKYTNEKI